MLLMFLTAHLFQFRFVDSEQYCNMALRLRCRRHEFLVVRLLSCACHLFSCELRFATDDVYFVPLELNVKVAELLGTRRRRTRRAGFQSIVNFPPPPTSSRTRIVLHAPLAGTLTIRPEVVGGHPRCDLAPLTTSFGTVGQWERQHLAMAGSRQLHLPLHATAHCAARPIHHVPHCSVLAKVDVRTCYSVRQVHAAWTRGCVSWGTSVQPGCTVSGLIAFLRLTHSLVVALRRLQCTIRP